ncbi:type III secretion system HrpP C-terminal domain-containing protein [Pseudomonas sp. LRF_L74]|uniref:type III secretion system HrpP C-terminal domain-containing protein n=1 Tax=Pseudomonas sp. LRF_L74 TaxID=3369422 RepID=UPI003F5DC069
MKTEQQVQPRQLQPHREPVTLTPSGRAAQPLPGMRRSDTDIGRLLAALETTSPTLMADGVLFNQLIQPVARSTDQGDGVGGSGFAPSALADVATAQLVDELAQRLPETLAGAFNVSLLMPNLGRIQVRAGKRDNQWDINLGFARRSAFERVQSCRGECEAALANVLAQPVNLTMSSEAPA